MIDLPGYVWVVVLVSVVGMPATTILALVRSARMTVPPGRTVTTIAVVATTVWAAWLVGSFTLAGIGAYHEDGASARPWVGIALLVTVVTLLVAARMRAVATVLADPMTTARLVLPQVFRVVGGVFLVAAALDHLPAAFALPAGLGDIAVGVAAPFVAHRLTRNGGRGSATWFHLLGILDLVVAVGVGYLAAQGPTGPLPVSPSTEAMSLLPLALIPTTLVPLALALHVICLRQARAARRILVPQAS